MTELHPTSVHCAVLFGIVAMVSSCGGSDLALPSDGPAVLEAVAGQGQTGTVGAPLSDSLVVRVTDADGAGLAGVHIAWSASGGGAVSPTTSTTDANGLAATQRVLGTTPGAYGTAATAPVAQGSPTVFLATAGAGAPDVNGSKVEVSPTALTASTGESEATVTVTVRDEHGNPVPGITVRLSATGSGNKITQPSAPTNTDGIATGRLSATIAGTHVVSASVGEVTFGGTAKITVAPGAPDRERSEVVIPDGMAGVATRVTIRLRDQFGNGVSGARSAIAVGVSGANPNAALAVAEVDGAAYTADYTPTKVGTDIVQISVGSMPFGGPARSTVVPGPAAAATTVAVVDGTATLFSPFVDISIEVRDAFGNATRRAGEPVTVTAIAGDERRDVTVSYDENTGVYVGRFRPWRYGEFAIEIKVNGEAIPGSPFGTVMRGF